MPVRYRNIPFTKYFDNALPAFVDFHFKSSGFRLTGVHLLDRPDSLIIDIAAIPKSTSGVNFQTIALRNQWKGDLKPYKVTPEVIKAGFNYRKSKKVPVHLISQVNFRQRFEPIGNISIEPDSVDIAGPENILNKTHEVKTIPLVLSDVFTLKQGEIELDKSSFTGLACSVTRVHYKLPVEEYTEGVVEVPVELPVSQRSSVTLLPSAVKITYSAPLSYFSTISQNDFKVIAELPSSGTPSRLEVHLDDRPEHARILSVEPEFIDYLISK